jgi:hypothetical protein
MRSTSASEPWEDDMTKTLVGTAVGALALGSLVTAQALKAPSADAASKTFESRSDAATSPVLVNCADGYRALVRPVAIGGQQASQVDCVATGALPATVDAWGQPVTYAQAQPTFASYGAAPRPAVQTQTVYRAPAPAYRTAAPRATRTVARQPATQVRSWKKSALIIGGSAAGGAAVGAVLDGKSGAKKGAIVGGVAGTVYDIATRSKTQQY